MPQNDTIYYSSKVYKIKAEKTAMIMPKANKDDIYKAVSEFKSADSLDLVIANRSILSFIIGQLSDDQIRNIAEHIYGLEHHEFHSFLKKYRTERDLTQGDIVSRLRGAGILVKQSDLSNLENKRRDEKYSFDKKLQIKKVLLKVD
ncbi:hypothetical protein D3C87_1200020 [compost metagenome]